MYTEKSMGITTKEIKIADEKIMKENKDRALVLAIQELSKEIRRLADNG